MNCVTWPSLVVCFALKQHLVNWDSDNAEHYGLFDRRNRVHVLFIGQYAFNNKRTRFRYVLFSCGYLTVLHGSVCFIYTYSQCCITGIGIIICLYGHPNANEVPQVDTGKMADAKLRWNMAKMPWTPPLGKQCGFSFLEASSPVQKTPLSYQKSI